MTISEILELCFEVIKMPFSYLVSSGKRVHVLYLFTSLLLALFVHKRSKIKIPFFRYIFKKEIWLGKSPLVDYSFIFFNSLVKVVIIAPLLVYTLYIALHLSEFLVDKFGVSSLSWSATTSAIIYTITIIVVNDFASFIIHYLMHKIPFLWEFHKIHHSATTLNPFTQYRIHPIELIINNIRGLVIKGIVTGLFIYLVNGKVSLLTFFGINLFNLIFLFFGANLRHSHVKLKYFNFLEYIFISPYQHQIHHSNNQKLYDTNMGSRLAIWDYLFGTLIRSKSVNRLTFGLGKNDDVNYNTFSKNLFAPFKNLLEKLTTNK
jgi:sterol desaturase/sphingolipid hydroxylase (fatty acid hydroxylase superfamily)